MEEGSLSNYERKVEEVKGVGGGGHKFLSLEDRGFSQFCILEAFVQLKSCTERAST